MHDSADQGSVTPAAATRSPMARVVDAVLDAAGPEGTTTRYFDEQYSWQARLRRRLAELPPLVDRDPALARSKGISLLETVNAKYRTRHPGVELPGLMDDILQVLEPLGWFGSDGPPSLLEATEEDTRRIAQAYIDILVKNYTRGGKRPFSLLSKWLHLCFPDTFVIYDQRATYSILRWSNVEYAHLLPTNPVRLQFNTEDRYWVRHWKDTGWYLGLLRFYCMFWQTATEQGKVEELIHAARRIEEELNSTSGAGDATARVTVLGIVDSLLWRASGDMRMLGLRGGD